MAVYKDWRNRNRIYIEAELIQWYHSVSCFGYPVNHWNCPQTALLYLQISRRREITNLWAKTCLLLLFFLLWPSILSDSVVKTHWLLIINCETSTILLIKSPWQQGLWWVILVHSAHVVAPMWKVFKLLNSTCWREEGNERRWCSLLLLLLEKLKTMLDSGGCDKVL